MVRDRLAELQKVNIFFIIFLFFGCKRIYPNTFNYIQLKLK